MYAHRRQFVVGPERVHARQDWLAEALGQGTWVSYCPELLVQWVEDQDGILWGLLGAAVQTVSQRPDPVCEIASSSTSEVPRLRHTWAGRWVLIGNGQIQMDANGLLGCFYGVVDGAAWVSSSPALLSRILFAGRPTADTRQLRYETGVCWYTPPRSRFAGMQRLLASQTLSLPAGEVQQRRLMPDIDPTRPYEEVLKLVEEALITGLKGLAAQAAGQTLWLGLTAGYDSRLMLAVARKADVDVAPFTRISLRTSLPDRSLPRRLARDCGYELIFVRPGKTHPERRRLLAEHSSGHISAGDAEPVIKGIRDELEGISFGGHGFAIASGFGKLHTLPDHPRSAELGARAIAGLFGEPAKSTAVEGLCEWLLWTDAHPVEHFNWRDRFFSEQRQAGWLSSKEQVYDLQALRRFPILNSARTYALLLGVPTEQRHGSQIQFDLIARLAPDLLRYPFNPPDPYSALLRSWRRISGGARRMLVPS